MPANAKSSVWMEPQTLFFSFHVYAQCRCSTESRGVSGNLHGWGVGGRGAYALLAFTANSAAQSSAQTHIHSAIVVIDISNNGWHSQVHWLVETPYLAVKASNEMEKIRVHNVEGLQLRSLTWGWSGIQLHSQVVLFFFGLCSSC